MSRVADIATSTIHATSRVADIAAYNFASRALGIATFTPHVTCFWLFVLCLSRASGFPFAPSKKCAEKCEAAILRLSSPAQYDNSLFF